MAKHRKHLFNSSKDCQKVLDQVREVFVQRLLTEIGLMKMAKNDSRFIEDGASFLASHTGQMALKCMVDLGNIRDKLLKEEAVNTRL
jgi:hypothetical protein